MKSIQTTREAFTRANKVLFAERKSELSNLLKNFARLKTTSSKNQKLHKLAVELVDNGYYAKPPGYSPTRPSSLSPVKAGIVSHMFKEWKKSLSKDLKKNEKPWVLWEQFQEDIGWNATSDQFVTPER